jgi:hypothetical protein
MYNTTHIKDIRSGSIILFNHKMTMSTTTLFKAFLFTDLEMNKKIAIVTYEGLSNLKYRNIAHCVWDGIEGVDYFLYTDDKNALDKMNSIVKQYTEK